MEEKEELTTQVKNTQIEITKVTNELNYTKTELGITQIKLNNGEKINNKLIKENKSVNDKNNLNNELKNVKKINEDYLKEINDLKKYSDKLDLKKSDIIKENEALKNELMSIQNTINKTEKEKEKSLKQKKINTDTINKLDADLNKLNKNITEKEKIIKTHVKNNKISRKKFIK